MSHEANTYVIDHESGAEMQRLIDQDTLLNTHMGTLFPDGIDPSTLRRVLDVACGPAAWILNVAFAHRHIHAVGIDISPSMIAYGNAFAQVQKLDNAELLVMDALQPLAFPNDRFDFVNGRLMEGFVKGQHWSALLKEMWRVTAPGGYVRLTEVLSNQTTSAAFNRIFSLIKEGFEREGHVTQTDEAGNILFLGSRLAELLTSAGIAVTGEHTYHLDWSSGTQGHLGMARDFLFMLTLMQPFLVKKVQVVSEEAYEQLLQALYEEMQDLAFQGTLHYKSVWSQKPGQA